MEMQNPSSFGGRGRMWSLDQRIDQDLGDEANRIRNMENHKKFSLRDTLRLSFLTLGVVYGDLGTSPLYVFPYIFAEEVRDKDDILAALSLIIYSIALIALIKYVFITLRADDNGEGGPFALYSLICRHARVNTIPNQHPTDQELTTYFREPMLENSRAAKIKKKLENSEFLQKILLVLVLVGTSMMIGDGILTPAISVTSSVKGIQVNYPSLPHGVVIVIASGILVGLFNMQRFGTDTVGFTFAPIIFLWFISIGLIGLYNIFKHEPAIFKAFSPHYAFKFFKKDFETGWKSLGGVLLAITGAEAMFADLGHFTALSIQIAFTVLVFPCLLLCYMGQAAFLRKHPDDMNNAFYKSIPEPVFWPTFLIATFAAIIASQATISATFSVVKQAVALGCFPRVKIIHTSKDLAGQIYIPEINWLLMVFCLLVTIGFGGTAQIGNAYGIAVLAVMLETTLLMTLIMVFIWQKNLLLVISFLVVFGTIESVYFSSVLFKLASGGWVPLAIALFLSMVMYFWHYGSVKRYQFEIQNKVPLGWILGLGPSLGLVRVPGIGLFYTELAHGVPSIFSHFLTHLPAIHSVLIFFCVKYLPVSTVPANERFLIKRIGSGEYSMFRCAARYGYADLHKRDDGFEDLLMEAIAKFIELEALGTLFEGTSQSDMQSPNEYALPSNQNTTSIPIGTRTRRVEDMDLRNSASEFSNEISVNTNTLSDAGLEEQVKFLREARDVGIVHILGNTIVKAREGSSWLERLSINFYIFLEKICRNSTITYRIPHQSLLNVGMVYKI